MHEAESCRLTQTTTKAVLLCHELGGRSGGRKRCAQSRSCGMRFSMDQIEQVLIARDTLATFVYVNAVETKYRWTPPSWRSPCHLTTIPWSRLAWLCPPDSVRTVMADERLVCHCGHCRVRVWLGNPSGDPGRVQAMLVGMLVQTCGVAALMLTRRNW
ncbi:hypothetical protein, variant 3 [Aphanomyces invadans]|uniref:Uncharacterized protein n=1 Tax=Aphanomyces invadans TaxID=157072 RepID=A0A024UGM5_9STRA|nr:hypothetical protein, variant 3 [Aphanomyces invadans]XP_008865182.1 hypothetical protein, variant 2 [Aphanomyces invadans]ETW05404.1 hypothetical protein, variant 2 [Aphanomyces invadans]ETW05405.1 hypothetical protein, variant 3 [Aphanomyces invadans]|eukprot:XP_008865181.1 hypothetical protein, variant 3 [Aphanomyces invadans]